MESEPLEIKKPYFTRHGETIESWVEHCEAGRILILPHLADGKQTVLKLGLQAIKDSQVFDIVDAFEIDITPDISLEAMTDMAFHIRKAFAEPATNDLRIARIPIFHIVTDADGKLGVGTEAFFRLLFNETRNGQTLKFAQKGEGNTTLFPIVDVLTKSHQLDPIKRIKKELRPMGPTKINAPDRAKLAEALGDEELSRLEAPDVAPELVPFDVRCFNPYQLLQMLQPEFPEEELDTNPEFQELIENYGGEARFAFAVRSYKRKHTLLNFKDPEGDDLVDENFSTVFNFVKSQLLHETITVRPHSIDAPDSPDLGR